MNLSGLDWDGDVVEGWTPFSAVVVLKCLDEDGDTRLSLRATRDLRTWDLIGLLRVMLLDIERQSLESWTEHEEDS